MCFGEHFTKEKIRNQTWFNPGSLGGFPVKFNGAKTDCQTELRKSRGWRGGEGRKGRGGGGIKNIYTLLYAVYNNVHKHNICWNECAILRYEGEMFLLSQ
jgi:hypothetical protein